MHICMALGSLAHLDRASCWRGTIIVKKPNTSQWIDRSAVEIWTPSSSCQASRPEIYRNSQAGYRQSASRQARRLVRFEMAPIIIGGEVGSDHIDDPSYSVPYAFVDHLDMLKIQLQALQVLQTFARVWAVRCGLMGHVHEECEKAPYRFFSFFLS